MGGFFARLCRESPLMQTAANTLQSGGGVDVFSTPPPDDRGRSAGLGAAPQGLAFPFPGGAHPGAAGI